MKPATPDRRPNILLFISDQQRADTVPGHGPIRAHMPHLARMQREGITFRNAFCTCPICTPARASILTGLHPHGSGIMANYDVNPRTLEMRKDVRLLADYLKPLDYACAYVGKWHLPSGDDRRGFTDFVRRIGVHDVDAPESDDGLQHVLRSGMTLPDADELHYVDCLNRDASAPEANRGATKLPLAEHPSTWTAQEAAAFIRSRKDGDPPFALVYSCIEPHPLGRTYNIAPCPFDRMYDPADMPLPETRRDPRAPGLLRRRNQASLKPTDAFSDEELRVLVAGYYGAVSYVDHLFGILMRALRDVEQLDNTLVIFTSDHGEMLGDHRMLKKGPVLFDELIRVPLVLRLPQAQDGGSEIEHLVSHVDLVPTILDYCGCDASGVTHGCTLRPMLEEGGGAVRDGVAASYHSRHWGEPPIPLRCWRTREWKYVETIGGDDELYHLADDPREMHNLVDDSRLEETRKDLKRDLYAWMREVGDGWPDIPRADFELPEPTGVWDRLDKL